MIQAGGDNDGENQGSHQQQPQQTFVQHMSDEPHAISQESHQPSQLQVQQITIGEQRVAQPSVTLSVQIHPQRSAATFPEGVAQAVNVITAPIAVGSTSSSGPQVTTVDSATYQHYYLIPNVSLGGGQVQSLSKPTHVTMSIQQGIRASGTPVVQNVSSTPTYTITPPPPSQNLARILAAANQGYTLCAGNSRSVSSSGGSILSQSAAAQVQAIIAGTPVTTPQNIQIQRSVSATTTILTVPVVTASMSQRTPSGAGSGTTRQDAIALHLAASATGNVVQQQQQMVVSTPSIVQQPHQGEVTRLHSYSLASASTVTHSSGTGTTLMSHGQGSSVLRTLSPTVSTPGDKRDVLAAGDAGTISTATAAPSVLQKRTSSVLHSSVNITGNSISSSSGSSSISAGVNIVNTCSSVPVPSALLSPVPNSPLCSPKPKRIKLEEKPAPNENIANMRKKICDYRFQELKSNKENYIEHLTELFFLQNGGNMMDYLPWKRRCTPQLLAFLKAHALDSDDDDEVFLPLTKPPATVAPPTSVQAVISTALPPTPARDVTSVSKTSAMSTVTSSHSTSISSQAHGASMSVTVSSRVPAPPHTSATAASTTSMLVTPVNKSTKSALITLPTNRLPTRQHSISAVYDSSIGSQEEIVERAKQEAYVMQRIAELRKEGLWSAKRLPKVQEPPRTKAHWDYLLEEMTWLATDFAQERKWKKAAAKKCGRMVMKYHQEKEMKAERREKEELLRMKKIASQMAKEIKQFWSNIEKLVEYKTQTRLEEKRKKALDIHLNFIVDQTEKYSSWLTRGMNKAVLDSAGVSVASSGALDSQPPSPSKSPTSSADEDFEPNQSESDDEETIAKEEEEDNKNSSEKQLEVEMLQKESEVPLEELLKDLPPEVLRNPATPLPSKSSESGSEGEESEEEQSQAPPRKRKRKAVSVSSGSSPKNKDEEFCVDSDEIMEDDEATMEEQEAREKGVDYSAELKDLQEEGEMSIEELYKKYADAYSSDFEMPNSSESGEEEEADGDEEADDEGKSNGDGNEYTDEARGSDADDEDEEEEEETDSDEEDAMVDVGMEYLIHPEKEETEVKQEKEEKPESSSEKGPSKEITDIAAAAESFQPKGNTLSTTQVFTKVPFLLKHSLREYQHIGLDWLVAMHDKKLNGILADEMGLGKTIQTIALLAHLACDKGIWGPHLIVVPTSVMLNWEMEFKKWCPAFKILTYYGSQKERKQKRQGWTKPNAFHVCITSYKLVIQDHQSFRRKKWKYFILDEAQHIKNFKSQRWQMLLNFQSSRRLLLTGTPLQNSLMELWSLMHFLMPNVFQSHREFRDWFANPVTGMIEGSHEYSDSLIKRLHKVLRPFLLRRLKCEVEKQLPKKYEHVVMCRLSKRQRFLYDDFMSQAKTKETLAAGSFLSVINVLMQLRKVCNHPNLFEPRPTVSPFMMEGICFYTSSFVWRAVEYDPLKHVSLWALNLLLVDLELCLTAFAAHRIKKFQTTARFIEEIDSQPPPPPKCPPGKIRLHIRTSTSSQQMSSRTPPGASPSQPRPATPGMPFRPSLHVRPVGTTASQQATSSTGAAAAPGTIHQKLMVLPTSQPVPPKAVSPASSSLPQALIGSHSSVQPTEFTLQLIQQPASGGIPVAQLTSLSGGSQVVTPTSITVQIQPAGQSGTRLTMPLGVGRLVQTTTGQHLLLTSAAVSGNPLETQGQQQHLATSAVLLTTSSANTITSSASTAAMSAATVATASPGSSTLSNHIPLAPKAAQLVSSGAGKPPVMVSSLATSRAMSPPVKQLVTPSSSMQPSPHSVPKLQPVLTPSVKPHAAAAPSSKPAAAAPPSRLQALTSQPPKAPVTCTIIPTTTTASKPVLRVSPMSVSQNNPANRQPSVVSSPKPITRIESARLAGKDDLKRMKSIFYMECLQQKRQMEHRKRLEHLGRINTYRCAACPIYGRDLIEAVTMISDVRPCTKGHPWGGMGYVHCLSAPHADENPRHHWYYTHALGKVIHTPQSLLEELEDIVKRFVFAIPSVTAPRIQMHMSHPPPSKAEEMSLFEQRLCQELSPTCTLLHDIVRNTCTQFPELRLIQYDCGKLQTLDHLLWSLKSEGHRVLIFTQMTRMLDVLEQFLNYHGHTYLRLDGNTRVDQRQALMERFNADKRIFCFILSTRSGGIGVNLTGADTVIFYDSDWNPTMDAQAQDRCHRIGQTRDVHIYRLISERTVEENILKKANQKRLLGDLAIEGGNFTTAFFKVNAIQELFGIEVPEKGNIIVKSEEQMSEDSMSKAGEVENFSSAQLEQALGMAEEENDIMAARTARAEAAAELAEFDETVPFDTDSKDMEEKSPAEEELDKLMEQLSPVEKYAMQFLESIQEPFSLEQLKQAEEEIEAQKKDWELGHLKALKEEEERMSALLEDQEEPLLTCSREDAYNQVYISLNGREQMPLWAPPTPPQDENDIYLDYSMCFLYETSVMPESQLPPIYVKKEMKRLKVDNSVAVATRKQKIRKEETVHVPRSLFDRPTAAILKMRREVKLQRVKGLMAGASAFPKQIGLAVSSSKPPVMVTRPAVETSQEVPEWLIYEDRAILQVIQEFQDLPLNLMVLSPAHIPNWDLVADVVNLYSRAYRSQKLCRQRYELTIVPREEGKILYDTNPKKQKKSKGIYKTKNNKPMKTSQLLIQDKNRVFNEVYMRRFDAIKAIANKRTPTLKSLFVTPTSGKNHKHIAVLAEAGISYDQPLTPVQVAAIRAERIAREKQKSQAAAVAAAQAAEQQLAAQRQQQQQVQVAAVQSASAAGLTQQQAAQAVIASLAQSQQLQAVHASQLTKAALQTGAVTSVSLAKTLGSSIVVNTGGLTAAGATAGTLASISKALGQVASSGALAAQGTVQAATVTAMNAATLRAQRSASVTVAGTTSPTMTVQEMVAAAATGQIRGLTTSVTAGGTVVSAASQPAVVSVAGLTSVQVQAATQRLSASTLAAAAAAAGTGGQVAGQAAVSRNLTHAQVHVFRQTALLHQQRLQEQHLKQQQQLKRLQVAAAAQQQSVQQAVSTGKVASNVASTLSTNMAAVAAAAQQRAAQQQPAAKQLAGKQAVARAMTEAEMAQLLKRQQLQQQQKQAVTQLTTAQLLAHAQLQVQQQQQQSQQSLAGTVQAPVATLVKTVSAPTSLGAAPSVTIPVSAVTMAGVNINVSLPQAKGNVASPKVSSTVAATAATVTQQQLRQLQLQQQLFQQHQKAQLRQQQQKAAQMAQVQSKAPVTQLPAQIGTVQIVQQQGGQMTAAGQATSKGLPAAAGTVTVQQIQQVFKQVSAAASAQGAGATTVTPSIASASVSQAQLLPHAVLQAAAFSGASSKSQALATVTLSQAPLSSSPTPSSSLVGVSATGTIPTNTALVSSAPVVQARVIPVSQATTATAAHGQTQYTGKQAIQVVAAAGLQTQAPLRSVSEAGMLTGTLKQTATHSTLSQPVVTSPMTTSAAALLKSGSAVVMSGQPQTAILQQVAPVNSGLSAQQAVTLAMRAAAAAATQGQGTQPQIQIQVQQAGAGQTHHQPQIVTATQQGSGQALLHTHSLQQQPQSTAAVLSASLQPGTVPSSAVQSSSQTASTNLVPSLTTSLTVPTGIESSHFSNAGQLAAAPQAQLGSAAIVTATPASASTTAQVVQAAIQMAKQQQQQQQQRQSPYTMRLRNSPKP